MLLRDQGICLLECCDYLERLLFYIIQVLQVLLYAQNENHISVIKTNYFPQRSHLFEYR